MRLIFAAGLGVLAIGLGGCGGGHIAARSHAGNDSAELRAISLAQANAVPLGISPAELRRRLGPPASGLQPERGYRCMYYRMAGYPSNDRFKFCFRSGRLAIISSAIG